MKTFEKWWFSIYLDKPKEIYRQCYEEGYMQAKSEMNGIILVGLSVTLTATIVAAVVISYVL